MQMTDQADGVEAAVARQIQTPEPQTGAEIKGDRWPIA